MFFSKRKRKNDEPQSFRLWPIVIVGILVIAAFFAGTQVSSRSSNDTQLVWPTQDLFLMATSMVREATAQARDEFDPFALTATDVVREITATAQARQISSPSTLDPLEMTATALIQWATESASQTSS